MVNSLQVVAHFLDLWTNKHYLVQFFGQIVGFYCKNEGCGGLTNF